MLRFSIVMIFVAICTLQQAMAQEKDFTLSSPDVLVDSGFLKFLLPRFSLKTGVKIEVQLGGKAGQAVFNIKGRGQPVMQGLGHVFYISVANGAGGPRYEKAQRFVTWLLSEVGKRTITQFTADDTQVFVSAKSTAVEQTAVIFEGNPTQGGVLALANCGRCHVIGKANRMKGIGSSPSFAVLRSLYDWQERFETFYLRPPHPAITQIEGVTDPFDPSRPPAIYPLFLTSEEVADILAYVSEVKPADLGAELIVHQ